MIIPAPILDTSLTKVPYSRDHSESFPNSNDYKLSMGNTYVSLCPVYVFYRVTHGKLSAQPLCPHEPPCSHPRFTTKLFQRDGVQCEGNAPSNLRPRDTHQPQSQVNITWEHIFLALLLMVWRHESVLSLRCIGKWDLAILYSLSSNYKFYPLLLVGYLF